jgi:hypothetical protein
VCGIELVRIAKFESHVFAAVMLWNDKCIWIVASFWMLKLANFASSGPSCLAP